MHYPEGNREALGSFVTHPCRNLAPCPRSQRTCSLDIVLTEDGSNLQQRLKHGPNNSRNYDWSDRSRMLVHVELQRADF